MFPARSAAPPSRHEAALDAFRPERFGFRRHREGWVREFRGLGAGAFAPLSWPHAHVPSYDDAAGERVPTDALGFLVALQRRTWGMPPEDLVPANVLAVLADTGGAALVAYDLAAGFNADGWLGFVIGFGARSGTLVSHMLGVREEARGTWDIGWHLKLLQGYAALRAGHAAATWTFDPMRGANARLNIEKLGAVVDEFTVDKYGVLRSELYGDVPSDRLTARWDLLAPATAERVAAIAAGRYRGPALADVAAVPEATPRSLPALAATRPPRLRYRIPGDIDRLMRDDPGKAIAWRQEMRAVLSALVTTKTALVGDDDPTDGPIAASAKKVPRDYLITGFATGLDGTGERVSYYVLERKTT